MNSYNIEDDLRQVYQIVQRYKKYNTTSIPPKIVEPPYYRVPKVTGINKHTWNQDILTVKPNTLSYIIYNLHSCDYEMVINAFTALMFYYKQRTKDTAMMNTIYKEVVHHYTVINRPYLFYAGSIKNKMCLYLVAIFIGSVQLYKVGYTTDIHQRMKNLQANLKTRYPLVSIGLKPLKVIYTQDAPELEKLILDEVAQLNLAKHKFNFEGSTEAFKSAELLSIFTVNTSNQTLPLSA